MKRFSAHIGWLLLLGQPVIAQDPGEGLETMYENGMALESENASLSLEWEHHGQPLDLNTAEEADLLASGLFTVDKARTLLQYRQQCGWLVALYELQAVPGWSVDFIRSIRPYITVKPNRKSKPEHQPLFRSGKTQLLFRWRYRWPRPAGLKRGVYAGNGWSQLYRFRFQASHRLETGLTVEKDEGERLDFITGYWSLASRDRSRQFLLGDFAVSQGQGILQWQGMRFGKGGDPAGLKKQSRPLRAYRSSGEVFFHRGLAFSQWKGPFSWHGFLSYRKFSAVVEMDSAGESVATSLSTSGYHRTASERATKNQLPRLGYGFILGWNHQNLSLHLNGYGYEYGFPLVPEESLHRLYAFRGKTAGWLSVDGSIRWHSVHGFSEIALSREGIGAGLAGLLFSPDKKVDLGVLVRLYPPGFASPDGQAFAAGSGVQNEEGVYLSCRIRPHDRWVLDGYMDLYRFPWVKYQVAAPSTGREFQWQGVYTPSRSVSWSFRLRRWSAEKNDENGYLKEYTGYGLRIQAEKQWDAAWRFRQRMEWVRVGKERAGLIFADWRWKPAFSPVSTQFRVQWVDTEGYDSRIYAFENDMLYTSSLSAYSDRQLRLYGLLGWKVNRQWQCQVKISWELFPDKQTVGSGLGETTGNRRTGLGFQAIWTSDRNR